MADLPANRTNPSSPFSFVGIDYAGPLSFKQGNRRKPIISKGYIAVYVCFSTKAVFFDLVVDLTTEAFFASMRQFCSIYGVPADIFSYNSSNFVGANAELIRLKKLLQSDSTQQAVHQFAHEHSCQWNFNLSRATHFRRLWESAVKSMKTLLLKSTRHQTLRYDELQTLLYEAAAILNSRPLVPLETHVTDGPLALTPAHFLTLHSLSFLPTDSSETIVFSYGKHWRYMQRLTMICGNVGRRNIWFISTGEESGNHSSQTSHQETLYC